MVRCAGFRAVAGTEPRCQRDESARGGHEGVADVIREPVVRLEERVRLDGLVRRPDDVELVVGVDLADVTQLGDVVVLAVQRDGALRCVEA